MTFQECKTTGKGPDTPGAKELRCWIMGAQSRLIRCADVLLEKGFIIVGVISDEAAIERWCGEKHLRLVHPDDDIAARAQESPFELFFSIDNFHKVPLGVLKAPKIAAINFHDGPLPAYAGVNATNWAIINREPKHGITWHLMTEQIDAGDILKQELFPLGESATALVLNGRCYEASVRAFQQLLEDISEGRIKPAPQDLGRRTYYGRWKRPFAGCILDWSHAAEDLDALVRGLDFGMYWNPLGLPKLWLGDDALVVRSLKVMSTDSAAAPGTILSVADKSLNVATASKLVSVGEFSTLEGNQLTTREVLEKFTLQPGAKLPDLDLSRAERITRLHEHLSQYERFWVDRLAEIEPLELPYVRRIPGRASETRSCKNSFVIEDPQLNNRADFAIPGDSVFAALLVYFSRIGASESFGIGYTDPDLRERIDTAAPFMATTVPLQISVIPEEPLAEFGQRLSLEISLCRKKGPFARDLFLRDRQLRERYASRASHCMPVVVERVKSLGDSRSTGQCAIQCVIPDQGDECLWIWDSHTLDEQTIQRMIRQFKSLLRTMALNPSQKIKHLCVLTEEERHQIVVQFNSTRVDYPEDVLLHQLFERQAELTPEAVALEYQDRCVRYRELNERSNQLAHYLQDLGVKPDTMVGVCMERSLELVVALYAILKAGAAYVPIDPDYPQERVAFMLQDAGVPILLTQSRLLGSLPAQNGTTICIDGDWEQINLQSRSTPKSETKPGNLAYMIYTSGSTGKPKGALNTHRGICNRLLWMQDQYRLTSEDAVLQKTPFSFDVSVWEFFWPLLAGARLIVAQPGGHKDPVYLIGEIAGRNITVVHFVPSMLRAFLDEPKIEKCSSLRDVICSGEALPYELQELFFRRLPAARLHNLYGPTEAAVDVTHWTCRRNGEKRTVPIGRPVANTQIYILDRYLQPVPVGVPGELHIGGIQVGRGYHNRPQLTAEKFIPDPFCSNPETRLYKTGDLCCWLPDGSIEYLGRMDFQVKIRGLRIELGEIESVVGQHPSVGRCVVTLREDSPGDRRLIAYVVCRGEFFAVNELRTWLKQKLPDYMVPSAFVRLDMVPMSPNGKVDLRALPAPDDKRLEESSTALAAPDGDAERKVAQIWQSVLGMVNVGRDCNFFDLGGDSLQLVKVRTRLQQAFGRNFDMIEMFQRTTVRTLAQYLTVGADEEFARVQTQEQIEARKDAAQRRRQIRQGWTAGGQFR